MKHVSILEKDVLSKFSESTLLLPATIQIGASQVAQWSRIHLLMRETQETQVPSLGQEKPLEKETATHSSILAWVILWTEETGRLQSRES